MSSSLAEAAHFISPLNCLLSSIEWKLMIYNHKVFGPVKPELGVIPSGQENHSRAEHLNFPGRELNVINFTDQYFLSRKINQDWLF